MAEANYNTGIELSLISKGLYFTVCDVIGPECIVKLRQKRWSIRESLGSCRSDPEAFMASGSMAEGFNFKSSDFDTMFINKRFKVLCGDLVHIWNTTDSDMVLLMETDNVSPGFTLLRCLKYNLMLFMYVSIGNNVYYSSKRARESFYPGSVSTTHGPCQSYAYYGSEFDVALTLECSRWPRQAMSFIHRSLHHDWPCYEVLTDICKAGCLLVPINSKQQTCSEYSDLEWRISFSLAEKKLIHSMNHRQLLCYGLLKIFLNEVLKEIPELREVLCSYFMKTAVFWEIMKCPFNWSKSLFLVKFWNVFSRVMKWVSVGHCPNFFIPEHNMFYGKIFGRKQRDVMLRLRTLYDEGYLCLLRCPSLYKTFSLVIDSPYVCILAPANDDFLLPQCRIDVERLRTIISDINVFHDKDIYIPNILRLLDKTASLIPSSDELATAIKLRVNSILQRFAIVLHSFLNNSNRSRTSNKLKYNLVKSVKSILRNTKTYHCFNLILVAECSYKNAEYNETVQIVNHIKQTMSGQPYMYAWCIDCDFLKECRQHGVAFDLIVKSFIITKYNYIPGLSMEELLLESKAMIESNGHCDIPISPLVFLNFLLILCYTKLSETKNRKEILDELQILVSSDAGYHIHCDSVSISWEILGICQQLCGDYRSAYKSYNRALNGEFNYFKQATKARIDSILQNSTNNL